MPVIPKQIPSYFTDQAVTMAFPALSLCVRSPSLSLSLCVRTPLGPSLSPSLCVRTPLIPSLSPSLCVKLTKMLLLGSKRG